MAKRKGKLVRRVLVFGDFNTIDYSTIKKIEEANKLGNKLIFGITNCNTANEVKFEKQKRILEKLKGEILVVPIKNNKPSNEEISKYQIDAVILNADDHSTYNCDVEYI